MLPGEERPSYAGLRVDVLERADGELMNRYQGEAVDFQEGPTPSSELWGPPSPCSPGTESQETVNCGVNSHRNEAQRELLAALDPVNDEDAGVEENAVKIRGGKKEPLRHQLQPTPTQAQQARWEALQRARDQVFSLRAIARELGMSRVAARKYALAESPPTNKFSAKERAKAGALAASLLVAN